LADDSRQEGGAPQRRFQRALVVEDGERLRATVAQHLAPWARDVRSCGSIAGAIELVVGWHPDLLILDFRLPDGDARELLRRMAGNGPVPTVVAMSAFARPQESFELAGLGVRAYLQKPFSTLQLDAALSEALAPPDLAPQLRSAVGKEGLPDMEELVRHTMVTEALKRAGGSRRGAARLLGVSRQVLQHILRKFRS
jgi:DNA-binding NtrC family response regulator